MTVTTKSFSATPGAPLFSIDLDHLGSCLAGDLILAGSPEYESARAVQNIVVDQRPMAIVRVADANDVTLAVNFARDNALPLVVRSGGHSLAGHSMVDGAVVVDLSSMKRIEIDAETRIARVEAGTTSGDLAGPANELGLALSTGDTSSVGFGGLATGGGIGFMARKYGLTIDSLLSAEVVTATGEIVRASEHQNADLFWVIRGGGGNFGIVTEFTFKLSPVDQILGGDLVLPASREVIRGYLEYAASAPDDLTTIGNIMHAPPAPFIPDGWIGKLVLSIIVSWTGSIEEGEQAIAPLRALAKPVADTVRPMPYPSIYESTAHQALPHGAELRAMFADDLSDEVIDASLQAMMTATSPYSIIHLRGLGGEMARLDPDATAFAHRDKRYLYSIIGIWLDRSEDASVHRAWTESLWQEVRHAGTGTYMNFVGDEGEERLLDAYPERTLARLAEIKQKYDPSNLFRHNQNIKPPR
ncbi:MAG: FAD-binding oxidoreductase [Thermomicrobiales bacterium]